MVLKPITEQQPPVSPPDYGNEPGLGRGAVYNVGYQSPSQPYPTQDSSPVPAPAPQYVSPLNERQQGENGDTVPSYVGGVYASPRSSGSRYSNLPASQQPYGAPPDPRHHYPPPPQWPQQSNSSSLPPAHQQPHYQPHVSRPDRAQSPSRDSSETLPPQTSMADPLPHVFKPEYSSLSPAPGSLSPYGAQPPQPGSVELEDNSAVPYPSGSTGPGYQVIYGPKPPPSVGVKQEDHSAPPFPSSSPGLGSQTAEERGLMGALAGGAAGSLAGHQINHGFLGAIAGAYGGHKLEDASKDKRKSSSRRSSTSSSSSDSGHHKTHNHQVPAPQPSIQHHAPPRVLAAAPRQGNFSLSSTRISLERNHELIAECRAINGQKKVASVSLNRLLSNDNGHFRWAKEGNFGASARDVKLVDGGKVLEAELRTRKGQWRRSRVLLDEKIMNRNGELCMLW
ncbi:CVNH domain-containing protein [Pseudomassariella vexata]|uniref:CVNH domain-domain-containing protein n=1 Tax=Pseudomassariella vexata TaxID=1141098 RepID=A0A1Y2DHT8_9PEZI|nr:CVNH domain-containing protein [Pseudomassariella vexata]ORY58807.1 CVNH domain-domain-containing protein [Pseudomassariella vexata]